MLKGCDKTTPVFTYLKRHKQMAESIKCDLCSKPATVHLTQIVNGKIHKIDLCEACAKEKGVTDPNGFSLADLLASNLKSSGNDFAQENLVCEQCGFTPEDYKKLGRLGCPACYEYLSPMITPMLAHMHKGTNHVGKIPHHSLDRVVIQKRIDRLNEELQLAVKEERYEDAALLRDEIIKIQESTENSHVHS